MQGGRSTYLSPETPFPLGTGGGMIYASTYDRVTAGDEAEGRMRRCCNLRHMMSPSNNRGLLSYCRAENTQQDTSRSKELPLPPSSVAIKGKRGTREARKGSRRAHPG